MDINIFCVIYLWILGTFGKTVSAWIWGLMVSLVAGHIFTGMFIDWMRKRYEVELPKFREKFIPRWLTGFVERLFFTISVAYDFSGTIIAMVGWTTIKMYQKWGRRESKSYSFSRMLGGLASMFFALIGGLIIKYLLPSK
jgi:hypothetical protein